MELIGVFLIIGLFIGFSILLLFLFKFIFQYLIKKRKLKDLNTRIEKVFQKYSKGVDKKQAKEKLKLISQIVSETEEEIKEKVKKSVEATKRKYQGKEEQEIIKDAGDQYTIYTSNLKSAIPETEEERIQDMGDLKNAISTLESLDETPYKSNKKKKSIGVGMFYDKMSRRFQTILSENKINEKYRFIPEQLLKYLALSNIKNINDNDILSILNVMKETNLIYDIVEINPAFHLILLEGDDLNLTNTDKVVLTFVYDEPELTFDKLLIKTQWKKENTSKILEELQDKKIITFEDNIIKVNSFGSYEQRKKWNSKIKEQKERERMKDEKRFRDEIEIRDEVKRKDKLIENKKMVSSSLEEKKKVVEDKPIKFEKKPKTKPLPSPQTERETLSSIEQTNETLKRDLKREIRESEHFEEGKEELNIDIDLNDFQEEEPSLEDQISEKILEYHEKFSMINGGFVMYEKIERYIQDEIGFIPEELLKDFLKQLKELKMIQKILFFGDTTYYCFKEFNLDLEEKDFISFVKNKLPLTKNEIIDKINWEEEKILETMKKLQEKGILRIENNKIQIPGIIQEEPKDLP
jgi:hypothetical protein